ncbi:MAG TPA: nucleotidyltransferase domain-containing protein [Methylomirabilota bacterium]|nr:nucleotidyltransferase domain-containing protein [Methylomirabilota bacterium]
MARTTVRWAGRDDRRARLEAELRRILQELPRLGVTKAILFGSLVSGSVGSTSDIDLILVAPSSEPFTRRLEWFYGALNPSVGLDLFVYTPDEFRVMAEANPFLRAALARGRVVYEA